MVLQPDPGYAASSTYKVEYKENPNAAGAYYINEATWNTMIHTGEFLDGVEKHLQEAVERGDNGASEALSLGRDQWIADLSATLPSDFSVPVTQAATQDPEMSIALAHAVEDTMCDEFAESIVEIDRIKVLDHGDFAEVVVPDVRRCGQSFWRRYCLCFCSSALFAGGDLAGQHLAAGNTSQTLRTEQSGNGAQCGICGKSDVYAGESVR